ncbi:MAG: hypothetical protein ACYC4L_18520 [Chloroflexota bacterium]
MDDLLARQMEISHSLSETPAVLNSSRTLPEILDYILTRAVRILRARARRFSACPNDWNSCAA